MKKLRWHDYISISIFAFTISVLWNSLHVILVPTKILELAPEELKGTYLGALTFVGLIIAMIMQPIWGSYSDRCTHPWGRRRPFILRGGMLILLFLAAIALSPAYWVLFAAYCGLQVVANLAHGPYQGLIPDLVPEDCRGAASGAKNFVEIAALALAASGIGWLVGNGQAVPAYLLVGAVVLLGTLATLRFVREQPLLTPPPAVNPLRLIRETFSFDVGAYPDYAWMLLSRIFFIMPMTMLQTFAFFFVGDLFDIANPAAETGRLQAGIVVCTAIVVLPAGWVADRIGRKPLIVAAGLLGSLGGLLMLRANTFDELFYYGAMIGVSVGLFIGPNWALATELIPAKQAARYLGLSNLSTAGGAALARLAGPMNDYFNAQTPNLGYRVMFIVIATMFLLGAIIVLKVREPKRARDQAVESATAQPTVGD